MLVLIIILFILLYIAIFYIIHLKRSIKKATNNIKKIKSMDTNSLITTTNSNQALCELLHEVNQMMITFRKLEIEIEKKNSNLQKTIINISHDLKTPLTSALGYVEILQKYDLSKDEQKKYETIIIDKLKRLSQLIEDFFAFTKIISNEENIEMSMIDVNRVFEEALVCYYQDFSSQNRSIHINGNKKVEMLSNERLLRRIFDNLIINALKHSEGDVYVAIDTSNGICYEFVNTLSEPIQVERIFDEFYTSDISRTKQNTGLGLAIVKEFTELLGGKISALVRENDLIISLKWEF
ncbi:MAG: sensor histidine kinase [Thomasclavelia sp.]|uniref:sensor histidine kinase n=1 Tax=Thomasclavelia sp. TaxID=3025757 RepID=UPI0039A07C35